MLCKAINHVNLPGTYAAEAWKNTDSTQLHQNEMKKLIDTNEGET
jgi:hypothetical protein